MGTKIRAAVLATLVGGLVLFAVLDSYGYDEPAFRWGNQAPCVIHHTRWTHYLTISCQ